MSFDNQELQKEELPKQMMSSESAGLSGVSMSPPPLQLQASDGNDGETAIIQLQCGGDLCIDDAEIPDLGVVRGIYEGAGSGRLWRTFVSGLSQEASAELSTSIRTVFHENQQILEAEAQARSEEPLSGSRQATGRSGHVQWDQANYDRTAREEGTDNEDRSDWIGPSIRPVETGDRTGSLREAFERSRVQELSGLCNMEVTLAQVLTALQIAESYGEQLAEVAESVRRILFTANEYAVVNSLNPEQSGRYEPTSTNTFCNYYVNDILRAMGVDERAIYGGNANQMNRAFRMRRAQTYWQQLTGGPAAAQARADAGRIVIITGFGNLRANHQSAGTEEDHEGTVGELRARFMAGHISIVMPQNRNHATARAHVGEDGQVDSPVESNGGGGRMVWADGREVSQEDRDRVAGGEEVEGSESWRPRGNWRYENRAELYERTPGQNMREPQWWGNGHHFGGFYEYIASASNPEALNSARTMGNGLISS